MHIKYVNSKLVDCFFGTQWDQAIRFDVENNKVIFATFDATAKEINAIRNILKKWAKK